MPEGHGKVTVLELATQASKVPTERHQHFQLPQARPHNACTRQAKSSSWLSGEIMPSIVLCNYYNVRSRSWCYRMLYGPLKSWEQVPEYDPSKPNKENHKISQRAHETTLRRFCKLGPQRTYGFEAARCDLTASGAFMIRIRLLGVLLV